MGLGRLYYYALGIAIASFCCLTHIKLEYPERDWKPHSSNEVERDQAGREPASDHERPIHDGADAVMESGAEVRGQGDHQDGLATLRFLSSMTTVEGQSHRCLQELEDSSRLGPTSLTISPHVVSTVSKTTGVEPCPTKQRLGNLHKRRASASPEKFDTGKFEPQSLRLNGQPVHPGHNPHKRARLENKLEIKYDQLGTPRIASFTPIYALPFGRKISGSKLLNPGFATSNNTRPFSVLNAILRNGDLLKHLVGCLPIPALITLYATSKPFHYLFNGAYAAFIRENMRTWAPGSDSIYPWRCYQDLCIKDPRIRQKSSWKGQDVKKKYEDLRNVPSIRWLQMVAWRYAICKDILIQLATKGLRCPAGTLDALRRMWFVMDLPLNAHRIALMRSEAYITKTTIFRATLFFLKVDMFFTDPTGPRVPGNAANMDLAVYLPELQGCGFTGVALRKLLMAGKHFTALWRVLHGWNPDSKAPIQPMNRLDLLKLWVRHKYHLPDDSPDHVKRQSIMGIPWNEVGTASLERTGVSITELPTGMPSIALNPSISSIQMQTTHTDQQLLYPHRKYLILPTQKPREVLLRPDELVMREGIRRQLRLHETWARSMLWGFCDDLGRNLPVRTEKELLDWSQGKKPMSYWKSDQELLKAKTGAKAKKGAKEKKGADQVQIQVQEETTAVDKGQ
ncbi:hypothetical protein LTR62_008580 [Meristemomyces frigidus]|uniref:Uncharacterized protein n=1 Tax=Meristemomyces frigidus TaxID=1508187 RepID=A0AAN7YT07_9PEZI|nr:hypothetical protein LTR62_008580 [Meristemomyces frigidus]